MRRYALVGGALSCLAVAGLLFALAADVSRLRGSMDASDVRYRAAPEDPALWRPSQTLPFGAGGALLGTGDDVSFRRALRALRIAAIDQPYSSDPRLALARNEAQGRLQGIVEQDADTTRRSRAQGLIGVLGFANALADSQNQASLLQEAIADFREAIATDPENGEAKVNLERALQRARGLQATIASGGPNPAPGGGGSKGAGAGTPGSGY